MTNERRRAALQLFSCIFLAILISGCSTMESIDMDAGEPLHRMVGSGDEVRITRLDGAVTEIRVTDITEDTIYGSHQSIALADVRRIEVKKRDVAATTAAVAGLTAIVVMILKAVVESEAVPVP